MCYAEILSQRLVMLSASMPHSHRIYYWLVLLIFFSTVTTCLYAATKINQRTGTEHVSHDDWPLLTDDMDFRHLDAAATHPVVPMRSAQSVILGDKMYSAAHLDRSLKRFLSLSHTAKQCLATGQRNTCLQTFNRALQAEFSLFKLHHTARLTAYYTPTIDVAPRKSHEYRYPIYYAPISKKLRHATRLEIDFRHKLDNNGLEMFYARDRYDVYLLHMEGGGRLHVHEHNRSYYQYISYAGDNGIPFRFIHEYMLNHGMLHTGQYSQLEQRQYLQQHPDVVEEVYASSPGYVFFNKTQHAPTGSAGVPLTANRSMAVDPEYYPTHGLVAFVSATIPALPEASVPLNSNPRGLRQHKMQRFFLAQDEGSYIKGPDRFDLYFGEDEYAYFLANNFHSNGEMYFLVLK